MSAVRVEAGEHTVLMSPDPVEGLPQLVEQLVDLLAAEPELRANLLDAAETRAHLLEAARGEGYPVSGSVRFDWTTDLRRQQERVLTWGEQLREAFTVRLTGGEFGTCRDLSNALDAAEDDLDGQALGRLGLDDEPRRGVDA